MAPYWFSVGDPREDYTREAAGVILDMRVRPRTAAGPSGALAWRRMPSVLICAQRDLSRDLAATLLGRGGIDRFKAARLEDARLLARTTRPGLVLLDRDLPRVRELLETFREEPATHARSIAVLAHGDIEPAELELLELGANAILRLPPDAGWDDRLSKLLKVPLRQEARMPVQIALESASGAGSDAVQALNLSVTGMLLESRAALELFQELRFRFQLPDGSRLAVRGRVVRQAGPAQYGVEFVDLEHAGKDAINDYVRSGAVG